MEQERIGSWMQTFTGKKFFPLDPRMQDIDIKDIAHSLSLTCRYAGHVTEFYSVAEHCVLMSQEVSKKNALWALLHDAAETYVGDMVRPLKQNMPEFINAEHRIMESIKIKFGLDRDYPEEVNIADNRILLDEKFALMSKSPEPWFQESHYEPLGVTIFGMSPKHVESVFLLRFAELTQ